MLVQRERLVWVMCGSAAWIVVFVFLTWMMRATGKMWLGFTAATVLVVSGLLQRQRGLDDATFRRTRLLTVSLVVPAVLASLVMASGP